MRLTYRLNQLLPLLGFLLAICGEARAALLSEVVFAHSGGTTGGTYLVINTSLGDLTVPSVVRGWYDETGADNGATATNNYIAGLCGSADGCDSVDLRFRNWFMFSPTELPPTILGATLYLEVPAVNGFASPQGVETYTLYSVEYGPSAITNGAGQPGYYDLGNGTVYGARDYTPADLGTTPGIVLNTAAVDALKVLALQGGNFILGGAVTSLDETAVPEPGTGGLIAAGCALFVLLRKR